MHILFVTSEQVGAATYRYRSENLARCLRRAGHTADIVYIGQSCIRVDADVVVLHRICAVPEGLAFVRAVRQRGAVLVYSTDDTVFDADSFPETGDPWESIRAFAPLHAEMLAESDAVLVSTDYLAQEVARIFGPEKPIFTVRNFLSAELLKLSETAARQRTLTKSNSVTLGYMSGSATHNADFDVISVMLEELLLLREKVRLLVVGPIFIGHTLCDFQRYDKFARLSFVPWRELPKILTQTDINLAPLSLKYRFVHAKSEIKFLEAAALGIPTVATATEGFTEAAPTDAIMYCKDNTHWRDNILRLLDPDYRRELAERAYAYVLIHGSEEAQMAHVNTTFAQIASLPRKGTGDSGQGSKPLYVNFPCAPPKYLAKAVLRFLKK